MINSSYLFDAMDCRFTSEKCGKGDKELFYLRNSKRYRFVDSYTSWQLLELLLIVLVRIVVKPRGALVGKMLKTSSSHGGGKWFDKKQELEFKEQVASNRSRLIAERYGDRVD